VLGAEGDWPRGGVSPQTGWPLPSAAAMQAGGRAARRSATVSRAAPKGVWGAMLPKR